MTEIHVKVDYSADTIATMDPKRLEDDLLERIKAEACRQIELLVETDDAVDMSYDDEYNMFTVETNIFCYTEKEMSEILTRISNDLYNAGLHDTMTILKPLIERKKDGNELSELRSEQEQERAGHPVRPGSYESGTDPFGNGDLGGGW